jgi:hypothetical protein
MADVLPIAPPAPPLAGEPLITLAEAATRFPGARRAARLHPATLTRWILKGSRALDGRRVTLEAVRLGSRWLTSEAALTRFAAALGARPDDTPVRSPATRNRASVAAERRLIDMGA